MKKMRVKELKPKIRVIRELEKKEQIEKLTEKEMFMKMPEDSEMRALGASAVKVSPVLRNDAGSDNNAVGTVTPVRRRVVTGNELGGAQLYNVGRGLGNEREGERRNYRQAQQTQAAQRIINVGGGSATTPARGGFLQGQQGLQRANLLDSREVIPEREYSTGGEKNKEKRIGPWE